MGEGHMESLSNFLQLLCICLKLFQNKGFFKLYIFTQQNTDQQGRIN